MAARATITTNEKDQQRSAKHVCNDETRLHAPTADQDKLADKQNKSKVRIGQAVLS